MRILLCEDEKELSNALVKILKHYHYAVDAAYDGQEALDYLEAENYDLMILDIMMPKVDGLTVLKTTRAKGNQIPIIMLTAKSTLRDKVEGLDQGANDYLCKPFEIQELLARIRSVTRSSTQNQSSILSLGNVCLNRATFDLYSEKTSIKLAGKEFQMMEMLMMNSGHIIPTDRFMDKIWGFDTDAQINVVWVNISYLRKKLESLEATIEIKATRNTGYCLQEVACKTN
ncbi:MAG: response regulator transcription factor [Erysipelotrichaceae bacterium]